VGIFKYEQQITSLRARHIKLGRDLNILALDGDDLRPLPLSMRKAHLSRLLARWPDGIFISPFEQGEIGPDLFRKARKRAWSRNAKTALIGAVDRRTGSK
jgi:hypothetical protein